MEKQISILSLVAHDTSSFHCSVCNKNISCAHQGEHDVIRHVNSAQHKKAAKALKNMQKLSFLPRSDALLSCLLFANKYLW